MQEIAPENLVNRSSELDQFSAMLRFEDATRILAISDAQGTGKTQLLRILEYNCKYRLHPRIPVSRVLLDDTEITSEFTLVKQVREQLRAFKCDFPTFDYFESALMNHYWAPFAPAAPVQAPGGTYVGQFDLREAHIPGNPEFTGVNVERAEQVIVGADPRAIQPSPDWATPDQELKAQQRCVQAFIDDLRTLGAQQTIAVMVDTFEQHERIPGLETWIVDDLIWPLSVEDSRPEKFVLVLAGRSLPNFAALLADRYDQLVRSRDSLVWESDHVRDFLALHGYGSLPDDDVALVCQRVEQGFSISQALKLAAALAPAMVGPDG